MGRLRRLSAVCAWPYWAGLWLIVVLLNGLSSRRRAYERQRRFIVRFWRWYFAHRHVSFYTTADIPYPSETGQLVVAVRKDTLDSAFLFQALNIPLVVPIPKNMSDFRLIPGVNWPNWSRLFRPTSYLDLGTDAQIETIKAMLDRGYTVLVYASTTFQSFVHDSQLWVDTHIPSLIRNYPNAWVVDHDDFALQSLSSDLMPTVVRVRVTPMRSICNPSDETDSQLISNLAEWLQFKSGTSVVRKQITP